MSTEQNKAIARQFFAEQDQRKGPLAEELCAANYSSVIGGNPAMNREGHSQFGIMFYQAFPDIKHIIEETIAEGDKVTVHFTLQGTHTGNFLGIQPTGKQISVGGVAIMHLVEGKVARLRGLFDQMGLMQQLGALPA